MIQSTYHFASTCSPILLSIEVYVRFVGDWGSFRGFLSTTVFSSEFAPFYKPRRVGTMWRRATIHDEWWVVLCEDYAKYECKETRYQDSYGDIDSFWYQSSWSKLLSNSNFVFIYVTFFLKKDFIEVTDSNDIWETQSNVSTGCNPFVFIFLSNTWMIHHTGSYSRHHSKCIVPKTWHYLEPISRLILFSMAGSEIPVVWPVRLLLALVLYPVLWANPPLFLLSWCVCMYVY